MAPCHHQQASGPEGKPLDPLPCPEYTKYECMNECVEREMNREVDGQWQSGWIKVDRCMAGEWMGKV